MGLLFGWRTFFDFANASSHEAKSAGQLFGWRTFFDFANAKLLKIILFPFLYVKKCSFFNEMLHL